MEKEISEGIPFSRKKDKIFSKKSEQIHLKSAASGFIRARQVDQGVFPLIDGVTANGNP
jgi:hypothetical protein